VPLSLPQILQILPDICVEKTKERGKTNEKSLLQPQFHPLLLLNVILEIRKLTSTLTRLVVFPLPIRNYQRENGRLFSLHASVAVIPIFLVVSRLPDSDQSYLKSSVLTLAGAIETRSSWSSKRISFSAPSPSSDKFYAYVLDPYKFGKLSLCMMRKHSK
jgi:hypothetical protein